MTTTLNILVWGAAPYVAIALLVGGTAWRFRHDRFGWTSRSSQSHESRLLKVGSPVFHIGLFMVIGGHVMGLLIPAGLTELAGITEANYHLVSLGMGTVAGLIAVSGLTILVWRRLRNPAVRHSSARSDRIMYPVLIAVLLAGLMTTVVDNGVRGGYDYRATVSPWFRDVLILNPHPQLMAHVPLDFKLHIVLAMLLLALWPFSRLVHAFSAPVHYLFRPYIVYRRRPAHQVGNRTPRRGWEPTTRR